MSGGGASYFPGKPSRLSRLIRESVEDAEQKRLEGDVNSYLQRLLVKLGDRNTEKTQEYIDAIAELLGEKHEIERFLFGGSVAKHTFVDGLSDVDALVVLDRAEYSKEEPKDVLRSFFDSLAGGLPRDEVAKTEMGRLAVTVTYSDGTEVQLLPAIRKGTDVCIADANAERWMPTNPRAFQKVLTRMNERLNRCLVPTIKLVKSVLSTLPDDIRPTGYHVEALSVEATKGYRGPATLKSLLLHIMTAASARVLRPIADVTSQSRSVDSYLGKTNSERRERLSHAIAAVGRRMNAAPSVGRWKEIIEG